MDIMKFAVSSRGVAPLPNPIDALVAEHGAWTVLLRAVRALLMPGRRAQPPSLNLSHLNDHLMRDIGMPFGGTRSRHWSDLR